MNLWTRVIKPYMKRHRKFTTLTMKCLATAANVELRLNSKSRGIKKGLAYQCNRHKKYLWKYHRNNYVTIVRNKCKPTWQARTEILQIFLWMFTRISKYRAEAPNQMWQ